jgi:hypothetical protein
LIVAVEGDDAQFMDYRPIFARVSAMHAADTAAAAAAAAAATAAKERDRLAGDIRGTRWHIGWCITLSFPVHALLLPTQVTAADGYLDTSVNNELVHAFERLVRQLLLLPNKPAVVVLNSLNPSTVPNLQTPQRQQQQQDQQQQQKQGQQKQDPKQKEQGQQLKGASHKQQQRQGLPFYYTIEDHFGVVAQYYELPWLSVRNALWQGLTNSWPGLSAQEVFHTRNNTHQPHPQQHQPQQQQQQPQQQQQQQQQQRQLQKQPIHLPNTQGHKFMADLAVSLLQQTYLQQLLRPLGPSDAAAADVVRVPMFTGNWQSHGRGCATGLDLRAAVRDGHQDWYFVPEGSPAHPRW